MKALLLALTAAGLCACATTHDAQKISATRDFAAANDLQTVDSFRTSKVPFHWKNLNTYFVLVTTRQDYYLVEFVRKCTELYQDRFPVDIRHESNVIRARFDTIRGCRIGKIYPLDEPQSRELLRLGRPPDPSQ